MDDKSARETLMLIDGYGLIYRSYFAFISRPLLDPQGNNVSAIYGFFRSIFALLKEYKPNYLVVAMDSRTPTFRHEAYADYKATRDKTPQDLQAQIPVIESILERVGASCIRYDGYEADDIIATASKHCMEEDVHCLIVSNDKDLLQLVDDQGNISALRYEKGGYAEYTAKQVLESLEVRPEQITDYLALLGDASDNIPGVKGIGKKGAADLLRTYGSIDEIYKHLDELTPANRKKLEEGYASAMVSKELVTLKQLDSIACRQMGTPVQQLQWDQAVSDFEKIGAKSLAQEVGGNPGTVIRHDVRTGNEESPLNLALSLGLQGKGSYNVVTSLSELDDVIAAVQRAGTFAFDVETDNIDEMKANVVGCSCAVEPKSAWYIPLQAEGKQVLPAEEVKRKLKSILEDSNLRMIGQNAKYDCKVLGRWGIRCTCLYFDTMVAAWLLDAGSGSYGMDLLAEKYLGYIPVAYKDVVGKGAVFSDVPLKEACDYAAEDADVTFRLWVLFSKLLSTKKLDSVMHDIEMPVEQILIDMELAGIRLLPELLQEYSRELQKELKTIESTIYDICGKEFNIHSTKQLQTVLFEERGLKPIKKTKTGFSTDTSVLELLALEDEVPEKILSHRVLSKLKSTYVDTLPMLIHADTGRIHTSYTQTGTATGRLSSRNPNLQNIPIRTEAGRKIRKAFVPAQGCSFISADYAQIELVVLAHLADDPGLKDAFTQGTDVHRHTASLIFQVPLDRVSPQQRRAAKTINFGVMYGMSSFRLARELSIPRKQADEFIEAYFSRYSGIKQFIGKTIAEVEKKGYATTLMGRIRPIPTITSRNKMEKSAAERIAVNTPIQGTAADIMKMAMIRIHRRLEDQSLKAKMLLQIHDEIILEVPEEELETVSSLVRGEMEQAVSLSVPLKVSIEIGSSWGDMHE